MAKRIGTKAHAIELHYHYYHDILGSPKAQKDTVIYIASTHYRLQLEKIHFVRLSARLQLEVPLHSTYYKEKYTFKY